MSQASARSDNRKGAPVSIREIIAANAALFPEAVAIGAPGRGVLSYGGLAAHIDAVRERLRGLGIARNDAVAVVAPNGPEMAAAFVTISSAATSAPLNPNYREKEFDFYLGDLDAKALVLFKGMESDARKVAAKRGIPVIELVPSGSEAAGLFELIGETGYATSADGPAEGGDIALMLHTSGTTSRPKMVPLSHVNVCTSAGNVAATLGLSPEERCLNIMPLFHIHGLVGALMSSLRAGAAVLCTEGFLAPRFFDWIRECRPTWYSAVPTMHQAILERAQAARDVISQNPLRLIRSSSASLAPKVMEEMERVFSCPVIESYGMTEAAHQMASNRMPPGTRKPGSVGPAAGPEVAIMDAAGEILEEGRTGEVVIRGANVTAGYANNAEANEGAFTGGWFRTGDEGYLDADGYLFLTGRLKEIINRAGEKISPREIDEVLLGHPAVRQAVAFAMPDERLGEEVAAAIVLREGAVATKLDIQNFAAERLADFKVPREVVFLEEVPKGPTGKLQRIGLAAKLGLTGGSVRKPAGETEYAPPRTEVEETIAAIWAEELGLEKVGVRHDFFELGGYSLLAARICNRIERDLGRRLPMTVLFEATTVEEMAALVEDRQRKFSPIVEMARGTRELPFFCISNTDAFIFRELAALLAPEHTFYGLHPLGLVEPDERIDIAELAATYLVLVRSVQPSGPYLIGGECSSGVVAFEMAKLLRREGDAVELLVMIDTPGPYSLLDHVGLHWRKVKRVGDHIASHAANVWRLGGGQRSAYIGKVLRRLSGRLPGGGALREETAAVPIDQQYWRALKKARLAYKPTEYDGEVVLFLTPPELRRPGSTNALRWRTLARGGATVHDVQSVHSEMLHEPAVRVVAEHLKRHLDEAQPRGA